MRHDNRTLTRRDALKLISVGGPRLLAACTSAPPAGKPAPTQGAAPKDGAPKGGGTLKMAVSRDILTFDPFNLSTGMLWHSIYDTLTRYDAEGKPQPRLAERWEVGDDGRAMTLYLRDGVRFHTGRALAAEDVVFTIKRAQDPQVAANILPLARTVTDAQAPDARTVVLRFDQPNAGIFDLFDLLFIQAGETIDTITSRGVGTGPFKLVEWKPTSTIKLARNEAYWQAGLPDLDEIDVQIAPDQQAMVIQLEARAVEVAQNPPPRDAKRLRDSAGFTVVDAPHGAQSYGIVLNVTRKPLDSPLVRQAVNHAIDRNRFVNTVLAEQGEAWCQPWPKHSIAYDPAYEKACAYDVERAKELMGEAGLAGGFETTITGGSSGTEKEIITLVQSDLARIGINARAEVLEEAVYRPRRVSGDFDISTAQYLRANKDPSSLLGTTLFWSPDTGNSQFRHPEYKRLIQEGAATLDPARRREIYRQITRIIIEQNFVLPLSPTVLNWAMLDTVRDFDRSLDGYEIFERTWLAS